MPGNLTVATKTSSAASKAAANFVGDGINDQNAINAALSSLGSGGGRVQLFEGTYNIRSNNDQSLGGVSITQSNVTLQGVGPGTQLILDANQYCNVIRIRGDNLNNIVVRDMYINGNRGANNYNNFEVCGVKCASLNPPVNPINNVRVTNCVIEECYSLNVQLWGTGMFVDNCKLGNASCDSAEMLGGPAAFENNYVEISGITGFGLGSDQASSIRISNNTVRVTGTGQITQAIFRTWGGRYRNIIEGNQVYVEPGGVVAKFFWTMGYLNIICNNHISGQPANPSAGIPNGIVTVNGGTLLSGNIFQNVGFLGYDDSGGWPISLTGNYFFYSSILSTPSTTLQSGNVFYP